MKSIAAVLIMAALSFAAQDEKKSAGSDAAPAYVQKLFVLKYADPGQISSLVRALGGSENDSSQMRAIAVTAQAGPMAAIEAAIKQLDVPSAAPKNVELTIYLVVGTDGANTVGSPVSKALDGVVAQLKNAFSFKDYRQIDEIEVRTRTGERIQTGSDGGTVNPTTNATVHTSIVIRAVGLTEENSTVRLDNLEAGIFWPELHNSLTINASLDVKEGQKAVIGRVGISREQALFLVLSAHVVQ